jgi:hypothetical protein
MVFKNFKTAEEIKKEISWYEKKLTALSAETLSIKLVGEQNTLMTIGATVENESLYGVLAVDFVEKVRKDLQHKIACLQKQLFDIENYGYSTLSDVKNSQSIQYGLKKDQGLHLKGVFNNIMNFFGLF